MKDLSNKVFVGIFFCILVIPLIFFNTDENAISVSENRPLNKFPVLKDDKEIVMTDVLTQFDNLFQDRIGFRDEMISLKAYIDFYLFDKINTDDMYLNSNGNLVYATEEIIENYQNKNLLTIEEINNYVEKFNILNDYFNSLGIHFIYVPCYDKQTIYPEYFLTTINRYGNLSKYEQIINGVIKDGNVNVVDFKDELLVAKEKYAVYSSWYDPTHWTDRGAYIAYLEMMKVINEKYNVRILKESEYNISLEEKEYKLNNNIYGTDLVELFNIINPQAYDISKENKVSLVPGPNNYAFHNYVVDNDLELLVVGDSYIQSFLMDDLAESFEYMYFINYSFSETSEILNFIEKNVPDIIIFENAERMSSFFTMLDEITDIIKTK